MTRLNSFESEPLLTWLGLDHPLGRALGVGLDQLSLSRSYPSELFGVFWGEAIGGVAPFRHDRVKQSRGRVELHTDI